MVAGPDRQEARRGPLDNRGFTLVELLLAMVVSTVVIGGATLLAGRMQGAYRAQLEGATAQQEGRYVLHEIERYLRAAGNNPYRVTTTPCPTTGTPFLAIRLDPNANGLNDDVRLQSDSQPVNGLIGGVAGACNESAEDVTIAHDPETNTVTLTDNNVGAGPQILSDAVVTGLKFIYRDPNHAITSVPGNIAFVETLVTVRTRNVDLSLARGMTYTVGSEIRLRSR